MELVRIKDGQSISIRTGSVLEPEAAGSHSLKRSVSEESDDDIMRSMARRRKATQVTVKDVQQCSECEKVFKRPCDLTYAFSSMEALSKKLTYRTGSMRRLTPGPGNAPSLAANTISMDGQLKRSETVT